MIRVTRLDGSSIVVNVDVVQWVERTPDTVLSLVSGDKLVVRESPEQLVASVLEFHRAVHRGSCPSLTSLSDVPLEARR
jgi:flagellar protein FlbD